MRSGTPELQQLADNEIRQIIETDALEEREAELFGVRIERTRMNDEIAEASSRWLEPARIERLVGLHLERELDVGRSQSAAKALSKICAWVLMRAVGSGSPRARGTPIAPGRS